MLRVLVFLGLAFVVILAAPATAQQRDPFVPLVTEAGGGESTTTEGGGFVADEPIIPAPDAERLADTGAPIRELVGLALALMGMGAATIVAVNTRRPQTIPHRAGRVA